jgi:rhodanese-related sulfurtransferase
MSSSQSTSYAGDVSAKDAFQALQTESHATLVDVRTEAEWAYVGVPDLGGLEKKPVLQEWQSYPAMAVDPAFIERLGATLKARGLAPDAPIYFLCRSGVRSRAAAIAMTAAGWTYCFNVTDGFEGPRDSAGHRGAERGWKAFGLPWAQT